MKTVCEKNLCNGCMACVEKCKKNAIFVERKVNAYNAIIDEQKCVNCHACSTVCPRNISENVLHSPIKWYQGWATDESVRINSTSGGAASAIMAGFMDAGGYVCSCVFLNGEFCYKVTNSKDDIKHLAGSKYVKSNPQGSYQKVLKLLKAGICVLFLGLPCHVAGMKNYIGKQYLDNLYTIDLICHGTPDPMLLDSYLKSHDIDIKTISDISFRSKDDFRVRENAKPFIRQGVADRYLYSFLKKVNYTDNCYKCQFASINRVSDLTLGDSWGTDLDKSEQKRGISLLLAQSEKGLQLIHMGNLSLFTVDLDNAVANNTQLVQSSQEPIERKRFFELFNQGRDYDKIMFMLFPQVFIRQNIKGLLIKLKLISGGGITYTISVTNEAIMAKGK